MRVAAKITILSLVLMMVFSLTSANNVEAAKYNWKIALEEIEGSVQHEWALEFKKRLAEKSDGEINLNIYPYGTLGSSSDISDQTVNGILEFAFSTPSWFATTIPEAGLFSLHYLWSQNMEVNKEVMANSDAIYNDLSQLYNEKNLKLLSVFHEGWQIWTSNKKITQPKNFDGVKIRVMGDPILIETYEAYGANPVRMSYSEVYSGLQLNMIDAQVQPYFANQEMKFYEQQKYLTEAKQLPFITGVIINKPFFDGLPKEYQDMIVETATNMTDYIFELQAELNAKRLDMMLEDKPSLNVVRLTKDQQAAFEAKAKKVWDSYRNQVGEEGAAILDKLIEEIKAAEDEYGTQ